MKKMITILGPTACGKTSLAAALAADIHAEIISGDSRQVYRGMDIGTGKDLADYRVGDISVPYHLIDIVEPGTKYNVYQYQRDFMRAYDDIVGRGVTPMLCGGSGLYLEAVLRGYRMAPVPENKPLRQSLEGKSLAELTEMLNDIKTRKGLRMHNTTDVDTAKRAIRAIEIELYQDEHPEETEDIQPVDSLVIGLHIEVEQRRERITRRLKARFDEGMADEIRRIIDSGVAPEELIYYGLEYKYVTEYVIGQRDFEETFRLLEIAIHQFAKRQMTWFRGMERRGVKIHWIDSQLPMEEKINEIKNIWQ
ncbi:MAG: tRNA (adenosine(37)-N6)-dimethylallyltransferase MiaA [Prevotellaceae bacterium]|nr:tRNA (adenosine(37)-N6)-dimethylallyltransferase MiaA [Prevotellaceae bacterium]